MRFKLIIILFFLFITLSAEPQKVALVLSGGGVRGLASVGVLKVIDELNIKIDFVAGTSMGATVGALYAMGYSGREIEQMLLALDYREIFRDGINREEVYIGRKRWLPYANTFLDIDSKLRPKLPQSIYSGNNLISKLYDLTYPAATIHDFNQFPIPFACTATNLTTGELKIFNSGNLHEALRASMSIPTIFEPFEIEGEAYVDGGLKANLPSKLAVEAEADFIIAVKTNTPLAGVDEMNSLLDILTQSLNVGITDNIATSLDACDIVITPDLVHIDNYDFQKRKEIIDLGERAARLYFTQLHQLPVRTEKIEKLSVNSVQSKYLNKIEVAGNRYLTDYKTKDLTNFTANTLIHKQEIIAGVRQAYNSELFSYFYPILSKCTKDSENVDDMTGTSNRDSTRSENCKLTLKVKEKNRVRLGFDLRYKGTGNITTSAILEMNNLVQSNSTFIGRVSVGLEHGILADYVKNFGRHWGIYYHLFGYAQENKIYSFNGNHEKMNSVRARELGATGGIGLFARDTMIGEVYSYTYNTELYQDIAELDGDDFSSSGLGVKLYHERLDDLVFPMQGTQLMLKFSKEITGTYSDSNNKKSYLRYQVVLPFTKYFSCNYRFEYGSYFQEYQNNYDPFYIGGIDSFLGLKEAERSAPIFKVNMLIARFKPAKNIFVDLQYNVLNLGNVDIWLPEENYYHGFGVKLGYRTPFGPIRAAFAIDEESEGYLYLSLGYNFDPFEFSRR